MSLPMLPDRARDIINAATDDWIARTGPGHTRDSYVEAVNRIYLHLPDADPRISLAAARRIYDGPWAGYSAYTRRVTISVARRLWDAYQARGVVQENPWRLIKTEIPKDTRAERILEPSEVRMLFQAAGRYRLLLEMLYYTGCRAEELVRIQWQDFHPHDGGGCTVTLYGKGSKTREVPVPDFLWETIRHAQPHRRPDAWMWPGNPRGPFDPQAPRPHLTTREVERRVAWVAAQTPLKDRGVSPHWFRHSHATHLLEKNPDGLLEVSFRLGHARTDTTKRYLHLGPAVRKQFRTELDPPDKLGQS